MCCGRIPMEALNNGKQIWKEKFINLISPDSRLLIIGNRQIGFELLEIKELYAEDTLICSSFTGALLLAETGLLDGWEATQHWAFESTFRRNFTKAKLNTAKVLVTTRNGNRIVMSGASAAWHDLGLYLIGRYTGTAAGRAPWMPKERITFVELWLRLFVT